MEYSPATKTAVANTSVNSTSAANTSVDGTGARPGSAVREYLVTVARFIGNQWRQDGLAWRYASFEELVATEGRAFRVAASPEEHAEWLAEFEVELGPEKQCFQNAGSYFLNPCHGELYYAEGYAQLIIPIHHGWLVSGDGRVIDPTWHGQGDGLPLGSEYVGVAFATEALRAKLTRTMRWGMFDYEDPQVLVEGVDGQAVEIETVSVGGEA